MIIKPVSILSILVGVLVRIDLLTEENLQYNHKDIFLLKFWLSYEFYL